MRVAAGLQRGAALKPAPISTLGRRSRLTVTTASAQGLPGGRPGAPAACFHCTTLQVHQPSWHQHSRAASVSWCPRPPVHLCLAGRGLWSGDRGGSSSRRPLRGGPGRADAAAPELAAPPTAAASAAGLNGTARHHTNGAASANDASASTPEERLASSSEMLRMVLQRRAERLRRQEEAAGVITPPPAAAAPAPAAAPPSPQQQEQQQPQQQEQLGTYPPPRYPPYNGSGPSSYAATQAPATHAAGANGAAAGAQLVPVPQPDSRSLQGRPREEGVTPRKTTTVRFWLKFKAEWGQRLKVVGTHDELGEPRFSRAGQSQSARGRRPGLPSLRISQPTCAPCVPLRVLGRPPRSPRKGALPASALAPVSLSLMASCSHAPDCSQARGCCPRRRS